MSFTREELERLINTKDPHVDDAEIEAAKRMLAEMDAEKQAGKGE